MITINNYISNQLARASSRLKEYIQDEQGNAYPQRSVYEELEKYLKSFLDRSSIEDRWIIIPGLRGVGKTTVLAQLFLNYRSKIGEQEMLYISLDEVVNLCGSSVQEALEVYEDILGTSFEKLTKPVFIFFDEIQYDPKWAGILKSVFDRSKKVFMICTGSSAVALQTNPDVARRATFFKMFPVSFSEFLLIREGRSCDEKLQKKIKEILFSSGSATEVYNKLKQYEKEVLSFWSVVDRQYIDKYLRTGTLPFAIKKESETKVYQAINLLLDKVINQDVLSLGKFDVKTLGCIKRIMSLITDSEIVSIQTLASILEISANTVADVLGVLECAELLIRILPYGGNAKKVKKPSRYQFMSSAMRSMFLSVAGSEQVSASQKGKLMEDIVAMTLYKEFIAYSNIQNSLNYDNAEGGADFILTLANKNVIPIELGIGEKKWVQVKKTMNKVKASKYGMVIHNGPLALVEEENIVKVPLEYFLLI